MRTLKYSRQRESIKEFLASLKNAPSIFLLSGYLALCKTSVVFIFFVYGFPLSGR